MKRFAHRYILPSALHRSPLGIARTNNFLGAFVTTGNTQTAASTDCFLGVLGLADNLEEQVERLSTELANVPNQRRQATSNSTPATLNRPLHWGCYTATNYSRLSQYCGLRL